MEAAGEFLIRAIALTLAGLMALAVVHKLRVLAKRGAANEPLMAARSWGVRRASVALALAATLEFALVVGLVVAPIVGLVACLTVLLGYSWELRRLEPSQPCNCLGNSLGATRDTALRRNALLALAALIALGMLLVVDGAGAISQGTVGVAAMLVAVVVASEVLVRFIQTADVAHARGAGAAYARQGGNVAS